MDNKIHILSEEAINEIAAGEVIENPASVVKELVENAIDAGASQVTIEILAGGFQSIIVKDDGVGMSSQDALMSLKCHATSKIKSSSDLAFLHTMGFRGEALASIAAISKFTLTTAQQENLGVAVRGEGGKVISVEPSARERGTTMEVQALFYNVPARKKFQKSAAQSSAEITRVSTLLALAHPHVSFELIQQRRQIFFVPLHPKEAALSFCLQSRSEHLLGEHFRALKLLYFKEDLCEGYGLIGDPRQTRYNRTGQYLFVNHRSVHCPPLSFAVRDGYGTRIDADRHPIYVIHVFIDPVLIDVNVHPQKLHIRLREETSIKHKVRSAVNGALQSSEASSHPEIELCVPRFFAEENAAKPLSFSFQGTLENAISEHKRENLSQSEFSMTEDVRAIGLFAHYLIIDAKSVKIDPGLDGVIWVDLLAAEARILYERLISAKENASQGLLLPMTFSCSKAEAAYVLTCMHQLHQLGFQLRVIGPTVFMVEAIPSCMEEKEVQNIFYNLIAEGAHFANTLKECARAICQAKCLRDKPFTLDEALHVFKELMKIDSFHYCPQGKATFHCIKKDEIENYFTHRK